MEILITSRTSKTPGPEITFNCPKCSTPGASAETTEVIEKNSLFWIIPLFTARYTMVTCGSCGKRMRTSYGIDEIAEMGPDIISDNLAAGVPFIIKFTSIVGIVLALIPFLGLLFAAISFAFTVKKCGVWRILSIIGLAISLLVSILVTVGIIFGN